ncbi:MAG: bifunctional diguanylate cyclase/phosphodiesterase [Limnobacter sp.]|uniref:bifunctional diguanylate cyclase/phosphodiesterase n=1 Tax=Limnobacter sp. TaxID=2003368 RepID=UPI001206A48C|nr:bifunctional diguanylate cyclase/phosphodiesterase [Limnobacter sp.]RZO92233.1 MAG: bifunctional diguanylate cyclase/phosphodiesterase [Limnobacter sp.]
MSLSNVLDDPLINELLDSGTSRYALLGHVNEELSLIAASKLFRQELGFKSGSELIVNRYGMAIYRAFSNALHRQQGWTGHVKVNSQWLRLQMLAHGEFGVIQEHDAKNTQLSTPAVSAVNTPEQRSDFSDSIDKKIPNSVLLNVDDKGRIKKLSPSLEEFLGQSSEQLENLDASNLVFRTDVGQFKRLLDQVKYQTGSTDGSFRLRNTFNDVVYFDWTAACIGADILLIGRSSNIHLEEALLKSEERINNILESMDDAFFAIDMNGYVNYLNEKGAELLGKTAPLLLGRMVWERAPHLKKTPLFKYVNQAKGSMQPETFQWQDPANEMWYQVKAYPSDELISIFFTDISSIKRNESKMRHQATHDPLTGLPNRLALSQTLQELLGNDQVQDFKLGLLFIDLDGFKAVNDTLGHDRGDDLLIAVSKRLRSVVRSSDIVARLSGDEFVITLPYIADQETAFNVGRKVVDAVSKKPFELGEKKIYVGASVGVALFPTDATDVEGLLKHADIAMYQAKQAGKNTVRVFHANMSATLQTKVDLENDLHDAILHDRIELHYQPRFNANGSICSVEALARMRSRTGELIPPAQFIPIAEETGLIIPMGEQVMRKACKWLKDTNKKLKNPISVSVNVSGIQLLDGKLCGTVEKVLKLTGLPAKLLELELTETVLMQNQETVLHDLNRLHELGVSLSIDDFGTGYSSLATLHRMPVQSIKLDRSFVSNLPNKTDSVILSRTVLAMAQALGLGVVAEGVETAEQRDFLIESGVLELQGFGLARPMTADDSRQFVWAQQITSDKAKKILA